MSDVLNFDKDCLFCKIIKGDIPSSKVYEDNFCFAFRDIRILADNTCYPCSPQKA